MEHLRTTTFPLDGLVLQRRVLPDFLMDWNFCPPLLHEARFDEHPLVALFSSLSELASFHPVFLHCQQQNYPLSVPNHPQRPALQPGFQGKRSAVSHHLLDQLRTLHCFSDCCLAKSHAANYCLEVLDCILENSSVMTSFINVHPRIKILYLIFLFIYSRQVSLQCINLFK